MYIPSNAVERDLRVVHALVRDYPLATWVSLQDDGIPTADPVPMMLDASRGRQGVLRGHVARANPVWQRAQAQAATPMLFVFRGPDGYISPSWYASKQEHHKVVPTWNYAVVHVTGLVRVLDDKADKLAIVRELTTLHEATSVAPGHATWSVDDAPAEYVDKLLDAIVGFEVDITAVEAKFKLNAHKSTADQWGMVDGLRARARPMDEALAALSRHLGNTT